MNWIEAQDLKFKIRQGSFYKTRDGRRVFISFVDDEDFVTRSAVIGIIEGGHSSLRWGINGRRSKGRQEADKTPCDIVAEWESEE